MPRVLLVDDDMRFATALTAALRRCGYGVMHLADANEALVPPPGEVMLLDIGLPDRRGIDVCRRLRERSDIPIIMLTARGQVRDRVAGLRCGADDCLAKPFGFAELQARIEALLRRALPRPRGKRTVGGLEIDLDRHIVLAAGEQRVLTRKEFQLLAVLAAEPGNAVPRERLLRDVWQTSWRGVSRTLDVHVATLRQKVGDAVRIETIRGVGYRVVTPASELNESDDRRCARR